MRTEMAIPAQRATPTFEAISALLCSLAERAQSLDVSAYEGDGGDDIGVLVQTADRLVVEALEAIDTVERALGNVRAASTSASCAPSPGMLVQVEALLDLPSDHERCVDLAFVSRLGLTQRRQALRTSNVEADRWDAISECSSTIREISKALSALEIACAGSFGAPSRARYYISELDRSVLVRRAYVQFRRDVHALGEPTSANVLVVLRRATTAIAKLSGRDAYTSVRVHDRQQLRTINARIAAWLRLAAGCDEALDGSVVVEGLRLFRDLSNLTSLMMGINRRTELVAHDREILTAAWRALDSCPSGEPIRIASLLPSLSRVEGCSDVLDALLHPVRDVEPKALVDAIDGALSLVGGALATAGEETTRARVWTERPSIAREGPV